MSSPNLVINTTASKNTPTVQPTIIKNRDENRKTKPEISTTQKVICGLSALAILGTGIYFAIRHGKVSGNKFKTIVENDGSLKRLLPNGNTIRISTVETEKGWRRTITVTDSNGKKICERQKIFTKDSDCSYFDVQTKKEYNSEGNETIWTKKNVYKTKNETKIETGEYYYNEKGPTQDDTTLLKRTVLSETKDTNGKLIKETKSIKERNKFGSFDSSWFIREPVKGKEGVIRTHTEQITHPEKGIEKIERKTKEVDANGNELYDYKYFVTNDTNKKIEEVVGHDYYYETDDSGKLILKDNSSEYNSVFKLDDRNNITDDCISYYLKTLDTGKEPFSTHEGQALYHIKEYKCNDGFGLLKTYLEDLEGNVIQNSVKQLQGEHIKWDTIIRLD